MSSSTWTIEQLEASIAAYLIANPPSGSGDFVKATDDSDDIIEGTTNKFTTTAEKAVWDAKAESSHNHDGDYAPALGADDNYVTDAEKTKIGTLVAPQTFVLASDVATGVNVTPVTLTGLVFTYEANSVYRISFMGRVQPGVVTTGCGFQFDLSSAVTEINVSFYHQLASAGTLSGGHSIADDASVGVSSGLPTTGTYPVVGHAILRTTGNTGTAQLRLRSETTAVITAKAGITMVVEKVA